MSGGFTGCTDDTSAKVLRRRSESWLFVVLASLSITDWLDVVDHEMGLPCVVVTTSIKAYGLSGRSRRRGVMDIPGI